MLVIFITVILLQAGKIHSIRTSPAAFSHPKDTTDPTLRPRWRVVWPGEPGGRQPVGSQSQTSLGSRARTSNGPERIMASAGSPECSEASQKSGLSDLALFQKLQAHGAPPAVSLG